VLDITPVQPDRIRNFTTNASSAGLGTTGDVGEGGAHTVELAERHAQLVDDLRAVRAQPPAAGRGVSPPPRDLGGGLGEHRDVHEHQGQSRFAHRAARHRPRQRGLTRVPAELGAEKVDEP
jgi:hypothetical protein